MLRDNICDVTIPNIIKSYDSMIENREMIYFKNIINKIKY